MIGSIVPEVLLTDHSRFEINENSPRNVLAGTSLAEKGSEGVVTDALNLVRRHVAIGHDSVFHAVKFPACIADLDSGLPNVNRDDFPL